MPGRFARFGRASGVQIAAKRKHVYRCYDCGVTVLGTEPDHCIGCGGRRFEHFDSKAEVGRYAALLMLQSRGIIVGKIERQVRFPLYAVNDAGLKVLVGHYVADFVYPDRTGKRVVEDVKGNAVTDLAEFKLRFMEAQGITVNLIKG